MRKIEFRLGRHVYQKWIRLSGSVFYMKDGVLIEEAEYETARALLGVNLKPNLPQSEEDLMWAIHNHIKAVHQ